MQIVPCYACQDCGGKYDTKQEALLCEAGHAELSLGDYLEWIRLERAVRQASATVFRTKNEKTDRALDEAVEAVMSFEAGHGLTGKRPHC